MFKITEKITNHHVVRFAFYSALAASIFVLENFIPKPIPFLKLGLANVVILILLSKNEMKMAFSVSLTRVLLGAFFSGTLFSPTFLMSFFGAVISTISMICIIVYKCNFSLIGISIVGAVLHNLTQLLVVRLVLIQNPGIFYLTPILIFLGLTTGIVTGFVANRFINLRIENDKINY